jgi:hypothetical protein
MYIPTELLNQKRCKILRLRDIKINHYLYI